MVEKARRTEIDDAPRNDTGQEWEVFVREASDDPLRHVGSVAAPTAEVANEQATRLFGWYAQDLWLCPAGEVCRFSTHSLDGGEDEADDDNHDDGNASPAVVDEDEPGTHEEDEEPRVGEL